MLSKGERFFGDLEATVGVFLNESSGDVPSLKPVCGSDFSKGDLQYFSRRRRIEIWWDVDLCQPRAIGIAQ